MTEEWGRLLDVEAGVARLDAIDASDPERAHGEADEIILALVDASVRAAYERLAGRASWWGGA